MTRPQGHRPLRPQEDPIFMSRTLSLFERLDVLADDMRASPLGDGGVEASVRRHLTKLLNTRAGSVSTRPDYGLTDFNDVAREHPDLPDAVAQEVLALIQAYEPRLAEVRVSAHVRPDDPTGLHFTIVGSLKRPDGSLVPATFDLALGRNRPAALR